MSSKCSVYKTFVHPLYRLFVCVAVSYFVSACAQDLGIDEVPYACTTNNCGTGYTCIQGICQPLGVAADTSTTLADVSDSTDPPDTVAPPDTVDPPDISDVSDTTDPPDMSDVSDTVDPPDVSDVSDTVDPPDVSDTPDTISSPVCGDGVKEGTELCDGSDFGDNTCTSVFFMSSGSLLCSANCTLVASNCFTCGNGNAEPAEACDGVNLKSQTCASIGQGFVDGNLTCNASCSFNTSACSRCGNSVLDPGEVCDGSDFGGQTCEGFGFTNQTALACDQSCSSIRTTPCTPQRETILIGTQSSAFRLIPPGTFVMGSPPSEPGRNTSSFTETAHEVSLSHGFWMKETEVTQQEWSALIPNNHFSAMPTFMCNACPAFEVSWFDTLAFANALSLSRDLSACYNLSNCTGTPGVRLPESERFFCPFIEDLIPAPDCPGYRLPTEAEWEYAARANTSTALFNGPTINNPIYCNPDPNLNQIAWYCGNSGNRIRSVAQKASNPWKLYDMSGNVWEWVWDWGADYEALPALPTVDPIRLDNMGLGHVIRGGGAGDASQGCRSAFRLGWDSSAAGNNIGFRVVRTAPIP